MSYVSALTAVNPEPLPPQDLWEELADHMLLENLGAVKEALKNNPSFLEGVDAKGNSVVHLAVLNSSVKALEYFIECGADLERTNAEGQVPLEAAVLCYDLKMVKILLKQKLTDVQSALDLAKLTRFQGAIEAIENDNSAEVE